VVDERDFLRDPVVGHMSVRLVDLLQTDPALDREWWPLNGCKSGKIRLSCEWKPLQMAGALNGADQYVPPIGVVRLWLKKATDVKYVSFESYEIVYLIDRFLGTWKRLWAAR
jgi:Ca2+-dependent lipid-binding protein